MEAILYGSMEVAVREGSHVFFDEKGIDFFSEWDDLSMKDQATVIELRDEARSAVKRLGEFLKSLTESGKLAA